MEADVADLTAEPKDLAELYNDYAVPAQVGLNREVQISLKL